MKNLLWLVCLVGCATEPTASDDGFRAGSKADDPSGWSHVVLRSADQVGISIDYVSNLQESHDYKPTNVDFADPLYANVWGAQLTGDEAVRVIVMNYERCERQVIPYAYALDLQWYGDHFSGDIAHDASIERSYLKFAPGSQRFETRYSGYAGNHPWCQDIAVVIDGVWQVDPVSNGHNFQFDMFAAR